MRVDFGLIGHPLTHSFSQKYFTEKFKDLRLTDHHYHLFDLPQVEDLTGILDAYPELQGLNVTIPYKTAVLPFIASLDSSAEKVGAVNVIKIDNGVLSGYNSDYYGFLESLKKWLPGTAIDALILGTGGASKAVSAVLKDLSIAHSFVSRTAGEHQFTYKQLNDDPAILSRHRLIVNTTPLGTYPNVDAGPDLPYQAITADHFVYDLVYNPPKSKLLLQAKERGAQIKNGLEMLHLQAEKSWDIWNA
jgi:shikimate dehydrogenase